MPVSGTIRSQFGTWAAALEAAGLISAEEAEYFADRKGKWIWDDEILDDLTEAIRRHGADLTVYRYNCDRVRIRRETGRTPVTAHTAIARFGGWENAKEAATFEQPDVPYGG